MIKHKTSINHKTSIKHKTNIKHNRRLKQKTILNNKTINPQLIRGMTGATINMDRIGWKLSLNVQNQTNPQFHFFQ